MTVSRVDFEIIPAIDLKQGQCVRLVQGKLDQLTTYGDPVKMAIRWSRLGSRRLHVVDLDGAFAGRPENKSVVLEIQRQCPELTVQIGGGIRDKQTLKDYFDSGISYCILGSSAVENSAFIEEAALEYPDKIILGVDAENGIVKVRGWQKDGGVGVSDLIDRFHQLPIASIIYTDISRDGMMQGVNVQATELLAKQSPFPVIASGGVKSMDDIKKLFKTGQNVSGVIVGKSLYTGDLDLKEGLDWVNQQ